LRLGIRLAIDVGSVRIGVAHCDSDGRLASPLTTVRRGRGDLDAIAGLAATDARTFAAALARRVTPVPVRLVDERFTTVIAHDALRQGGSDARGRRLTVDKAAAALLLQGALDMERSTGQPAGELVGSAPGGTR